MSTSRVIGTALVGERLLCVEADIRGVVIDTGFTRTAWVRIRYEDDSEGLVYTTNGLTWRRLRPVPRKKS